MWFRSPCVNKCCASWEKVCLIYELTFCRKNASFEREKLFCLTGFSFCSVFLWCTWWLPENSFAMITSVVINFFFQKYISRYFFSFFQSVFYCRRCKLFTLSERNWAWHWLYYWLSYFKTLDRGIVGIVKERNVSGGIKRRQSTWLALQGVLVIIPGRILRYLAVAAAQQTWEGQKRGAMLRFSRWAFRYMHLCFFKLSPTANCHRIF